MKKLLSVSAFAIALSLTLSPSTFALHSDQHYSLFGEANYVTPGNASDRAVKLVSDTDPAYGGVNFPVETGTTFADLTALSTDYMFETDDSCAGGSPRFQIKVDTGSAVQNIFVYLGPPPNYTLCPPDVWTNSGNLLEATDTVDTSQLTAGTFYDPYAAALLKYGSLPVLSIQLVTDSGWAAADGEQAVSIDNTQINSTLFTYELPSKEVGKQMCKDDNGWMTMTDLEGNTFKNQGQCVSFFAKMK